MAEEEQRERDETKSMGLNCLRETCFVLDTGL
jgi:hypothetical protein